MLITGSTDGLGLMAARLLLEDGHSVTLHARTRRRADTALASLPAPTGLVIGDVATIAGARHVAEQAAELGRHDAVIHNVGIGYREPRRVVTADGLSHVFAVNVLAPYVLTTLLPRPDRLVHLSSGMNLSGNPGLDDPQWERHSWDGAQAYADSRLFDIVLALGVAHRWPRTLVNSVEPGWVATEMGGAGAPDDLRLAPRTQVQLAVDPAVSTSGGHYHHGRPRRPNPAAHDVEVQDALSACCAHLSGLEVVPDDPR